MAGDKTNRLGILISYSVDKRTLIYIQVMNSHGNSIDLVVNAQSNDPSLVFISRPWRSNKNNLSKNIFATM